MRLTSTLTLLTYVVTFALPISHVVPGKVFPNVTQTWDMHRSTIAMICNSTGPVDQAIGSKWGLVDLDWNGGKPVWSAEKVSGAVGISSWTCQ